MTYVCKETTEAKPGLLIDIALSCDGVQEAWEGVRKSHAFDQGTCPFHSPETSRVDLCLVDPNRRIFGVPKHS